MIRVAHVITGLAVGGAESALQRLVCSMDRSRFESHVISLTGFGPMAEPIHRAGVPVHALGLRAGVPDPRLLTRAIGLLRKVRPDVVQTWMYHGDLIGGLAARIADGTPVVWNIRTCAIGPRARIGTYVVRWSCARLSSTIPRVILSNSRRAADVHRVLGYDATRMRVIPNGFDVGRFSPSPERRAALRAELGVPSDARVVGMAGRFHVQKDHATFFRAAASIRRASENTWFLLCGDGLTEENPEVARMVRSSGLASSVRLLGRMSDMPSFYAALDVNVLSSIDGEAFPNVIGEAMACGVPCVATNIGDCAAVIADDGVVVPPASHDALAAGVLRILALEDTERAELRSRARRRIERFYSLDSIVHQYEELYASLAGRGRSN